MSTQKKKAKEIKKIVDLYGTQSILQIAGAENSCNHVPYNDQSKKVWIWPEDDGCLDSYKMRILPKDFVIDRFGGPYGTFFSVPNTNYIERSLPYMIDNKNCKNVYDDTYRAKHLNNYHQYRIIDEKGLRVKECIIAPAFDKPGGVQNKRKQYSTVLDETAFELLKSKKICEIPKMNLPNDDHEYYCTDGKKLTNSDYPSFK